MLEDLNSLLNSGWVINLPFNSEEHKILNEIGKKECKNKDIPPNRINIYQ